jgi:hypothetical protein
MALEGVPLARLLHARVFVRAVRELGNGAPPLPVMQTQARSPARLSLDSLFAPAV